MTQLDFDPIEQSPDQRDFFCTSALEPEERDMLADLATQLSGLDSSKATSQMVQLANSNELGEEDDAERDPAQEEVYDYFLEPDQEENKDNC